MSLTRVILALAALGALAGCEAIGNIFEAGMWVGMAVVVGVLALIGYVVAKMKR